MVIDKNDIDYNKQNDISPVSYKSNFEYSKLDLTNLEEELSYIFSLPKSGTVYPDYIYHYGEKLSKEVVSDYAEIILKGNSHDVYENVNRIPLKIDDFVIVETENGKDIGRVADFGNKLSAKYIYSQKMKLGLSKILSKPDYEELKFFNKKLKDENDVLLKTKDLAAKYNIEMKVTEAAWQIDRQKLTIFFTAPQRIDFRELVKELAKNFKTRIELRQISSREETKRLGNFVGPCGRELCCTTFICNFEHVTLEHARIQQLSNNITKLSGNCGRLKCCIKFEYDTYLAASEKYPPLGSVIEIKDTSIRIIKIDIFSGKIITFEDNSSQISTHTIHDISEMIKEGKLILPDKNFDSDKFNNFEEELRRLLE